MRLEAVGYWFNEAAPSANPRPQRLVGKWPPAQRARVLAYLRAGAVFERYRARSFCRFRCGIAGAHMGHRDLSDGVFVWPEGLAHYVAEHGVQLPPRFIRRALAAPAHVAIPAEHAGLLDDRRWLAWGRAHGAQLDLRGWSTPTVAVERALAPRLAGVELPGSGTILLVRRAAVVLALARGRVAIVRLGRRPTTQLLVSWDDWPLLARR